MRKIAFSIAFIFLCVGVGLFFLWNLRPFIAARMLSQNLHVSVSIEALDLTRHSATIHGLIIGNPRHFKSPFSCTTGLIDITSSFKQLRANPLIIDEILMEDIVINLENRKDGSTNWSQILATQTKPSSKDKHYLIKLLVLRNLNVQVTQHNGQVKRYPTIEHMQFQNISDETGFPIDEIEKAIFNKVMQDLYQKLDLNKILQPLVPGMKSIPSGILPGLFN